MSPMDSLFNPNAIAVIGASNRPMSPGKVIVDNLLHSGFNGTVLPVNPNHTSVSGVLCYPNLETLPLIPELAIICIDHQELTTLFDDLDSKGIRAAILIANSLFDEAHANEIKHLSKQHNIRMIGPNSLGICMPWTNLNASLSPVSVQPGKIAFISQSGAIATTVLDWANDKQIGFSAFVSIGSMADVNVSEVIDYLSMHSKTEAILLYVEHIQDARRFMSAARAAARNKRVLVLKGARSQVGKELSMLHHGGSKSLNIVYDSAFDRCGLLRVHSTHELFAAAETLTHSIPLKGKRLAMISNGSGPAVIASDVLNHLGGKLAEFSEETLTALGKISSECTINPLDLSGDMQSTKLLRAFSQLLDSKDMDAILIMFSPSAIADPLATATKLLDIYQKHPHRRRVNLLTNWLGETSAKEARSLFSKHGVPTYRTPESSVMAFMHLVRYRASQVQLMETPLSIEHEAEAVLRAKQILSQSPTDTLTTDKTTQLLNCYQIETDQGLNTDVTLHLQCDATFGPVILLGRKGEVCDKQFVAGFPPLNQKLAETLIKKALRRGKLPPVSTGQFESLTQTLVRFSQLIVDLTEIQSIHLSGAFDDSDHLKLEPQSIEIGKTLNRVLAIRPYPIELESIVSLKDASEALLRPIRPEDEPLHAQFINNVSKEDLYKRFFSDVGEFDHQALANLTQIDYDREMALVLEKESQIIGVVRAITDIRSNSAEFAVLIRSDMKGQGLGRILMQAIIDYCRDKGIARIEGMTMPSNKGMVTLAQKLGFSAHVDFEEGVVEMALTL
ncbi:bifunctional acetate--CoA ligase family protein/GNAT family N-acetyltransferase [Vibrio breoganii]|uniref:bifunctional acetate--CoA ligase family protein/GNAT family N-acetyltransferase n=1 Tax=Vibrio breoganii TaxID=553239 RepID=UPI000C821C57|nr:bifunctional acetate--CoA ligase family protein/GNAT family N-acetyltransferase [Vibrio breoganii]PMH21000.1 GNAT family N-acetyltransferase [Vibrio breoganii]PMM16593.1 GNAT family N-acetyltransferase [Vibrio breoganii]PMM18027.1 GNAT family N-acetyltransferase [Vibrio breoganii]